MGDLSEFTAEELKEEIEKRKIVTENIPVLIDSPDLSKLKKLCADYLESVTKDEVDDDHQHYIFEEAMNTFYGPKVFSFINKFL